MDLIVLAADRTMEHSVSAILSRWNSVGMREISFDSISHPQHDGGVRRTAFQYLRPYLRSHQYALVCLDFEGCGSHGSCEDVRSEIQALLDSNGWKDRSRVVIFEPELEIWLWVDSPTVATALGWRSLESLRRWLTERGFLNPGVTKPARPKEAVESALRKANKAMSTAVYLEVARNAGFANCVDNEFQGMLTALRMWFPPC